MSQNSLYQGRMKGVMVNFLSKFFIEFVLSLSLFFHYLAK